MTEPNELEPPDPKPAPPPNGCQRCDGSGYARDPNYTGQATVIMPCKACHPGWWSQMAREKRTYADAHSFPERRRARP